MLNRYFFLFLLCSSLSVLAAQDCRYQLILTDASADGWNGAELTLRQNGVATNYRLTSADGDSLRISFSVADGDVLSLGLTAGAFFEEIGLRLLDNNDSLLYALDVTDGPGDNLFSTTASCVACAAPQAGGIDFFRLRATSVDLAFEPTADALSYRIQYGEGDFDPRTSAAGSVVMGADTLYRINDLEQNTSYTFWIDAICAGPDTSDLRGPYRIQTQLAKDVGVTQLVGPVSGCGLGSEDITIGITNFGGEPQAFFNVDFFVNDMDSPVSRPADGIFTGVVGVDSTETFTFDASGVFNEPGIYTVTAWTSLEDDADPSNDTMVFTVVNVPLIDAFPYREDFQSDLGFEQGDGFWYTERAGRGASSWMFGNLGGPVLDQLTGSVRGWATNLNGNYNDRELSYLYSPCFDLSAFEEDPVFSALLYVDTEADFDAAWLEATTDGGQNWAKVEVSPRDFNWFNDRAGQRWTGDGGVAGRFVPVSNLLGGLAGEQEIQLRFVFESDGENTAYGLAMDNVVIQQQADLDLSVDRLSYPISACNDGFFDTLYVEISNPGLTEIQTVGFELNFIESGMSSLSFRFADVTGLELGQQQTARIPLPLPGNILTDVVRFPLQITGTVIDPENESALANNTAVLRDYGYRPVPTLEDFETGSRPASWETNAVVTGGALRTDFTPDRDSFGLRTDLYGLIDVEDVLTFELNLLATDADTALTAIPGKLLVAANTACSDSIVTGGVTVISSLDTLALDLDTIRSGTYTYDLSQYAEQAVRFIVRLEGAAAGATVTFDDFRVSAPCTNDLDLGVDILPPTDLTADDANATVIPDAGLAPYTFAWSNGATTPQVDSLTAGDYEVVVTDALGCTDTIAFTVDLSSSVDLAQGLESLTVFPNPTTGQLSLSLQTETALVLRAEVYDLSGRQLLQQEFGQRSALSEMLDLTALPAGTYLLRIASAATARTLRVVKR